MSVLTAVSSATPLHSVSTRMAHTPVYVQTDIKVVVEGFVLVCPFTLSINIPRCISYRNYRLSIG